MPKTPAFTPQPAIEKLPLATRKDLRDKYEARLEEFQGQLAEILGKPFTVNINPNEVWAYNKEPRYSPGNILSSYVEGFIYTLKSFIDKYGDEGRNSFNEVVTKSEVTVAANELGGDAPTISADIKGGVFRILFKHDCLGSNTNYLGDGLLKAIQDVPRDGFSLVAKTSIAKTWEESVDDLTTEIGGILGIPDIKLDPNFEEVYKTLVAAKSDSNWQSRFGNTITDYYRDGLKWQLERQGFKGDDMLQEGLAEAIPSKTIRFRVVPKLKQGYSEAVIEDGVLYLQTSPDKWYSNVNEMGSGIVDLL